MFKMLNNKRFLIILLIVLFIFGIFDVKRKKETKIVGRSLKRTENNFQLSIASQPKSDFAYVTLLSSPGFLPGVGALIESLRQTGTEADLVVMVLPHVSHEIRMSLCSFGAIVKVVQYVDSPYVSGRKTERQIYNYSKLHAWSLPYKRVVFLDADVLVLRNLDEVFLKEGRLLAVENYNSPFSKSGDKSQKQRIFNSGMMVLKPSPQTFSDLMEKRHTLKSYNGGDQGFLNSFFFDWVELPLIYNVNKMMYKFEKDKFPSMDKIKLIHFIRKKPWVPKSGQTEIRGDVSYQAEDFEELTNLWQKVYIDLRKNLKHIQFPLESNTTCVIDNQASYIKKLPLLIDKKEKETNFTIYPFYFRPSIIPKAHETVTLVTHIDGTRKLSHINALKRSWDGPISITLFCSDIYDIKPLPLPSSKSKSKLKLKSTSKPVVPICFSNIFRFWLQNEALLENVSLHVVEPTSSEKIYPAGLLYQIASTHSFTDLNFILDSNLLPSESLYPGLIKRKYSIETLSKDHVFVIPAFKYSAPQNTTSVNTFQNGKNMKIPLFQDKAEVKRLQAKILQNKRGLVSGIQGGLVQILGETDSTHIFTDATRYLEDRTPYYIKWGRSYEPFIIFNKSSLNQTLFYSELMTSSATRSAFSLELHLRGYHFALLSGGFVLEVSKPKKKIETYLPVEQFWLQSEWLSVFEDKLRKTYECPVEKKFCGKELGSDDTLSSHFSQNLFK